MTDDTGKPFLSVCVITGNEEENIERCLRSVEFADEIVVVDSFSTDRTVEIARQFTDRVFQHRIGLFGRFIRDGRGTDQFHFFISPDLTGLQKRHEPIVQVQRLFVRRFVPSAIMQ